MTRKTVTVMLLRLSSERCALTPNCECKARVAEPIVAKTTCGASSCSKVLSVRMTDGEDDGSG